MDVSVYKVPTETPEADGTIDWESTTMVLLKVFAAGKEGMGYSYAPLASASVIHHILMPLVVNRNALDIPGIHYDMVRTIRNSGNTGIAMMAVSAIDNALWDLKAKILELPLCELTGRALDGMLIYGSGGFTSYSDEKLSQQLGDWVTDGIQFVKMKIGAEPEKDPHRISVARKAIGEKAGLFVDANGAFTIKEALQLAETCRQDRIEWFEEPVTSDNLEGLRFIRERSQTINIAAGEYGYNLPYFMHMLGAGAVDVLQADATRCGGISNFLKAGAMAEAFEIPFSSHCAPSLHLHAALSLSKFYIAEYFFDHVRIEKMFFDGFCNPDEGYMKPDLTSAGMGIRLREKDVKKFLIS